MLARGCEGEGGDESRQRLHCGPLGPEVLRKPHTGVCLMVGQHGNKWKPAWTSDSDVAAGGFLAPS